MRIPGRTKSLTRKRERNRRQQQYTNKRREAGAGRGGNRGPLPACRFPPRLRERARRTAALTSAPRRHFGTAVMQTPVVRVWKRITQLIIKSGLNSFRVYASIRQCKWTQAVGRSAAIREDTSEPLAAEVVGVGTGAEFREY